jgi:hypothetical protein
VYEEMKMVTREAGQRLRRSLRMLEVPGLHEDEDHADLVHRLRSALAYTEAAYAEMGRLEREKHHPGEPPP